MAGEDEYSSLLLEFVHEAAVEGVGFGVGFGVEFLDEFALFPGEFSRDFNDHSDDLIALAVAAQIGHALAAEAKRSAGLGSRRYFEFFFSTKSRDADRGAEGGLRKTDGHFADDIFAFALEDRVGLDFDEDMEVASRAAIEAGLAFAADAQPEASVNPGGDVHVQFALNPGLPSAGTAGTRFADALAGSPAPRAGLGDAKKTVGDAHLPGAAALGAYFRFGAGGRARSSAVVACFHAGESDVFLGPEGGFFQSNGQFVFEVVSGAGAAVATHPAPSAKQYVKEIFEGALEASPSESAAGETAAAEARKRIARLAIAIILAAALGIFEHIVGPVDLFEFFLGGFVSAGLVGMIFVGQLEVGTADFFIRRIARDAKNLIGVSLSGHTFTLLGAAALGRRRAR